MKKLFLTFFFGFIMTVNFNAQTQDLDTSDRVTIVENMNKYAIGTVSYTHLTLPTKRIV